MATTHIQRTQTAGDTQKWTFSCWVKRGAISSSAYQYLMNAGGDASNSTKLRFGTTDAIEFYDYQSGVIGNLYTTRLLRDPSAWYHIVAVWDTNNVTAGDRMKLYVNGVEETSFTADSNPSSGANSKLNASGMTHTIGWSYVDSDGYLDACMSHVHFCDGYAYAASDFGETDATSGIWKIKTSPSVTYGTNGFFLKMEDRTNLDLDSGTNTFTFTTTGTLTATYDNPSDNFCTWSKLNPQAGPSYFYNGNTMAETASDATWRSVFATLANSTGKFYFECECDDDGGGAYIGILATEQQLSANTNFKDQSLGYAYKYDGEKFNNSTGTSYGSSYGDGDIIGMALDLDNDAIWFSKNGVWQNSATIGEIGAGDTTYAAFSSITTGANQFYAPTISGNSSQKWKANFGNGYFGATAITSAGTNASGIGSFEYDVPTNFTAWSTKGFNE